MRSILRILGVLALAAPILCQDEAQPYFSLSSSRTFGSHEERSIMLSGWRVDAVQIRVYRVKDAVQFFRQIEDLHSFGGRMPRPEGKRTLLERIHNWKRELRRDIRLNLRGQFNESPRAHWNGLFPRKAPPASTGSRKAATYFAEAPVLNQDQLVLSFLQPVSAKTRWSSSTVPIAVRDKGLYLVEAANQGLRAYTIVIVSDVVLVTKIGRDRRLAFLADRETGEPVANADISVMTRNGKPAAVKTNSDGLADLPMNQTPADGLRVLAAKGADVALGEIASWTLASRNRNWTGYVYTDRPVYRPGDTMHFRGILRMQAAVGYEIPARRPVSVQISDSDGKPVYQKTLTTNANGIIHDELPFARASALGNYFIQVKSGESEMNGNFEVQEYKKPEYEVRVTPAKPRVIEGETVEATIDARYYFGEPVNGAKVKYSVYRSRYWFPLWYDADEQGGGDEGGPGIYEDAAGEQISQEQGQLDPDGKLTIRVPTTLSDNKIDYRYRVEANVTDQAGREISGTGWLIATYGSFVLNVQPERYFYQPQSSAGFKIEARDYDNKPVSANVHVEIALWNWRSRSAGEVKGSTEVTTDANGAATAEIKLPATGGDYRITAKARTPENRVVEDWTSIWVASKEEESLYGGWQQQRNIQIVPDKKTYQSGDKASILIIAGQANTSVLVTVEGRDIRLQKMIRSQGPTALFEYSVSRDDEPGFFVTAQFIRKGQIYQGQKRVKVPPDDHKLNVKLATDKSQYLPGQTATYNLEVTSTDGKPAAQADFSLGVVDEAIYAIRRDETPDILTFFYGREWNSVYTENSLMYFFSGEAGKRRMQLAKLRQPSQLAQLKPERLVQPKIRKAFPDTAFWAADITTDSSGRAQARVEFPDSLTTWRATARGVAPEERFGGAVLKTIVRKNLILRLAVPRFFVQGDEVVISGLVHNYLPTSKKARMTVSLEGITLAGGDATQDVEIASRSEVKVNWRVKAQAVRHAKITAQALTDEESDALELELPVNPPGVPVYQAKGGTISNSGSENFTLTFPTDAVAGSRSLSIRLSPSIAGSLFSALDYLTSYPYGCVEQTMSSFLPNVVVTKAMTELKLKQPIDQASLAQKVQAGLDRLYSFQHEDGGWGWWVSDESHPFMTAYVVAGLSEARSGGIRVNDDAISKGAVWIEKDLAQAKNFAPDLRAYMGYALALAGRANNSLLTQTYTARADLSPYGMALLGLALEQTKDSRASDVAAQLEQNVKQNETEAWWPAMRDEMLDFQADVTPEASAYAMKLLTRERSGSPLLPKVALWLVNHRSEGYWWSSTKQTAMVIYGLIDYVKATNELNPNLTATVTVNGQAATTHIFNSEDAIDAPEISLDEVKLQPGINQVQVSSKGQGRLYYSVSAIHYSNQARLEKQGAIELNLLRDYFRMVPNKSGERIIYDLSPLEGSVTQGDILSVRLTVTGSDWRYLMVEDPIPAGTEFIERDNLYEIRDKPPWWRYWFTRRELHDDRMAIFQTYFGERQQQYFYLLKVVNPGLFHVSPARVQPMYQPAIQATTEAKTLEVK
jgi:alpha-2-macroglobulin